MPSPNPQSGGVAGRPHLADQERGRVRPDLSHAIVSGASEHAIFMVDPHGTILTWNPGVERVLGYPEAEWVGQHASLIFTPEDRESGEPERELETAAENGHAEDIRWHVRRDGTRIWADGVVTPLYDDAGTLVGYAKVMRDATDRKKAQTALRDAEERLRLAAEATQAGTFDFNPISGGLRWDERCKALFGLPAGGPVDYAVFLSGVHPEDRARTDAVVQRTLDPDSGANGEYEIEFRTVGLADGVERWVLAKGRAFFDAENKRGERFIGTIMDVTDRRRAEDALRERDERYRMVTRATKDAVWDWDMATNAVWWNEGVRDLFGYEPDQVGSDATWWYEHIHEGDRERVVHGIHEVIDGAGDGHFWSDEYRFLRADGTYSTILDRGYVMRDGQNKAVRVIGAMQDVTREREARADAERALADARKAEGVLDAISEAVVTLDRDFRITYVNAEAARVNKKPAEAFVGRLHWDEWPAAVGTEFERQFRRAMAERVVVRFLERYYVPGEYDDWIDVTAYPAADEDGGGLHLVYRDVTERVRRERRERFLTELTERVRTLTDPEAVITDAVRSVGEFLQVSRCTFADIDLEADTCTIHLDYCAGDSVASIAGVLPWSSFGSVISDELQADHAVAVDDVHDDVRVPPEYVAAYEAIGVRAHVTVPAVYCARLVSVISAHSATPRRWRPEEVQLLRTVMERTWFTVEVARQHRALREEVEQRREQGEYLRRLVESSPDCIKTLDLDGHVMSMNEGGQQIMEVDDFSTICGVDWLTFWEGENRDAVRAAIETAKAGGMGRFQGFGPTMKGTPKWWDVVVAPILGADGKPEQLLGVSRDVTDQKQVEDRKRARLTDIFMQAPAFMAALRGPSHVIEMTNPPYDQLVGHRDVMGKPVAEALPEVVEQGFIDLLDQVYRTGEPFVGKDVHLLVQVKPAGPMDERFVDLTYQPLFDEDGRVSGVLAHGIDLTERKRLEQERERLLEEQRTRAEREALVNQIGAAVRATDDPEEVQARAVTLLGEALGADRCFFTALDPTRPLLRVGRDWRRKGLPPMTGEYPLSGFGAVVDNIFRGGPTAVITDARLAPLSPESVAVLERFGLRSQLAVALYDGGTIAAVLTAAMVEEPRVWAAEEVAQAEAVAALTRTAIEGARVQQRERNIAQQLQAALQPPPPPDLPGLALEGYYRPALAEAGVGGDAYDVFAVEKGCTALVVFDLAGKGLDAASQVATVRNMLRYALYTGTTIAHTVTTLNRVLAEQGLLTGFATLFVGVYDQAERTLTYANCGQEPGLVRRAATGEVEHLPPTGPVLGGFSEAEFTERVVALAQGDVVALFTDGLTEVGPTRRDLLRVEGVANILRGCCTDRTAAEAGQSARHVLSCLVAGVDAFARGGVRDDIALLVGVVGTSSASAPP